MPTESGKKLLDWVLEKVNSTQNIVYTSIWVLVGAKLTNVIPAIQAESASAAVEAYRKQVEEKLGALVSAWGIMVEEIESNVNELAKINNGSYFHSRGQRWAYLRCYDELEACLAELKGINQ